jgi:hypothetical protein
MHKFGDEEKILISVKPFALPVVIYNKAARTGLNAEGFERAKSHKSADFSALTSALFFALMYRDT